ncbi:uncharacterized protein LY89DRAFT_787848 [Mollisia scopiformis]|uniref:Fe2OG dioxygenase domain-containing protein n=1 Tax=Mollisia scopiformis TaxID=149040 RepID=A0A132BAX4_MOLSC|nr:uncharacterized protein LY89DRAFT_787848 [Mollisia scopiformis]KUJ09541.1 hypothetical protein LY89DRAFT_787848 [Mollisia scopiformis]
MSDNETQVKDPYGSEIELKEDLDKCLSGLEGDGSFALFEQLQSPPNPGLCLKDGGLIGLPLNDHDAELITRASHAAPFGKGEETIVDTTIRKTWELSPKDFEIRNPAWTTVVEQIVAKVSTGLGVDAAGNGVSAELYKLLLYDEGAMFKPHQDSEKAPRMFATLVIALPSKHEGGEVHVTHAGKTKIFATSTFSEFDASYLAWFSDVTHEVCPVTEGRRLVLTYNLIHTTLSSRELGAHTNVATAQLKLVLKTWEETLGFDQDMPKALAFLLEHQYTDSSLCYDGLKGRDKNVGAHLRECCSEVGFISYLASFELSVEGGCDEDGGGWRSSSYHEIIEEVDRTTTLKRVVELDGLEVAKDLDFNENDFVQDNPFNGMPPDDEDYSGFTGNEGVSATHFYHRTVAIIVPKSYRMEFFFPVKSFERLSYRSYMGDDNDQSDISTWIDRFSNRVSEHPDDAEAAECLSQICKMVVSRTRLHLARLPTHSWERSTPPFPDDVLARVVGISVDLDDRVMFIETFKLCPNKAASSTFRAVGIALLRNDLESLLPDLSTHLSKENSLAGRLEIIDEVKAGLQVEAERSSTTVGSAFQTWLESELDDTLLSTAVVVESPRDGAMLASLSKTFATQEVFNKILPTVKRNVNNTVMAVAFAIGIVQAGAEGELAENVADTIFHDVTSDLADCFSLGCLGPSFLPQKKPVGYFRRPPPEIIIDAGNSSNIATLLCYCVNSKLDSEIDQIILRLTGEMETVDLTFFDAIYLPFLKTILSKLSERNAGGQDSRFCNLFRSTLVTYLARFVKEEPQPAADWAQRRVGCNCQDCQRLNAFLVSPHEKVGRFALAKKRRGHLHSMLGSSSVTHETDRRGNPQTLVVTKTNAQYQNAHKAWTLRCNVAKQHLKELETEALKDSLGDLYDPIMSLSPSVLAGSPPGKSSRPGTALSPSASASNRVLPPITKRKVPEVIVIDD